METLSGALTELMGDMGQRELSRATRDDANPDPPVNHVRIGRILNGQSREPEPAVLRSLAWALSGGDDTQRAAILSRLRVAAGFSALEPPPLTIPAVVHTWPTEWQMWYRKVIHALAQAPLAVPPPSAVEGFDNDTVVGEAPTRCEPAGEDLPTRRDVRDETQMRLRSDSH